MKIVIDVDKLLEEGRITTEEYERLNALAVQETGSLAFNILIDFGVIATAGVRWRCSRLVLRRSCWVSFCPQLGCIFPRAMPRSGDYSGRYFCWWARSPLREESSS